MDELNIHNLTKILQQYDLLERKDTFLLAVSGGIDSMVLFYLFSEIYPADRLYVAHCNFGLRYEDSDEDEAFVSREVLNKHIPLFVKRFDTFSYSRKGKMSIQEAARKLRYEWFYELLQQHSINWIVLAHHLNDKAETFFLNLLRGSGVKGLIAMQIKEEDKKILRPLLSFTREQIYRYAQDNHIPWREDKSNISTKYNRNYFRHKISKHLAYINPQWEKHIFQTQQVLKEYYQLARPILDYEVEKTVNRNASNREVLNKTILQTHPYPRLLLYHWLSKYGVTHAIIDYCLSEGMLTTETKKFFLSDQNTVLLITRDTIEVCSEAVVFWQPILIHIHDNGCIMTPYFRITWKIQKIDNFSFEYKKDNTAAYFDYDKLPKELQIRQRQNGDYMYPLGMQGKKKISDLMIDLKISEVEKYTIPLLAIHKEIIWMIGYRQSEKYKIGPTTQTIIIFEQE